MAKAVATTAVMVALNMAEKQAAEYLGISVHSLRRWRVYGGGPKFCKMGSRITYPVSELDAFQAACLRRSTSDLGPAAETPQGGGQAAKARRIGKGKTTPAAGCSSPEPGEGGEA